MAEDNINEEVFMDDSTIAVEDTEVGSEDDYNCTVQMYSLQKQRSQEYLLR